MRSEIDKVWTRFRSTLTLERKGEKLGDRPSHLKCRTLKHLNIVAACAEMRQGAALPCPDAVRRTVSKTVCVTSNSANSVHELVQQYRPGHGPW
jgi:hypothetical protein